MIKKEKKRRRWWRTELYRKRIGNELMQDLKFQHVSGHYKNFIMYYKKFNIIDAYSDCDTLQLNIESITNWCKNNKLALNINKCKVMIFSRKANPVLYNYSIDGQLLERCEKI
jgi:hypothetical protein